LGLFVPRRRSPSRLLPSPLLAPALVLAFAAATARGQEPAKPTPAPADPATCCDPDQSDDLPPPTDRKSKLLRASFRKLRNSDAPFFGEAGLRRLDKQIENLPPNANDARRLKLLFDRGQKRLWAGQIDGSIQDYEACLAILRGSSDLPSLFALYCRLGIAWMRLGERSNCVAHHNQDSCLLPLKDGAIHVDKKGSENAARWFTMALELSPADVSTMWLLNVAHMTLGTWPDAVPEKWRIPAASFAAERTLPRMFEVAHAKGIHVMCNLGGAAMDDFDGDGRLDIVLSSLDPEQSVLCFRQQPDGSFKNVTNAVGLRGQGGGGNLWHFDADNDGRLDLLVQRGAWMGKDGELENSLLIQQADGTFVDRTLEAGIEVAAPSQAACVADVDNDGDLDLFIGYEDPQGSDQHYGSRLWRNRGDGTYEDVSFAAGVERSGFVKGCAFGDVDGDRLPDLYVTTMQGDNHLYRNDGLKNGVPHFTDVAKASHVAEPQDSFSAFFFDYDNDGDLDLYASCYAQCDRVAAMAAWFKDRSRRCDVNRLYQNDGHGSFTDVTQAVGLDRICFPMGSNFGDVDNDGFPDIYLATGAPEFASLFPNVLYHNDRGRRFEDVTASTDTGVLQKGHGVSFGDLDGDGDQDLLTETGGAYADDKYSPMLFENPGHGNHWLTVRLRGRQSNRFGIGARIKATLEEPGGPRNVFAFVGANSSFGSNSLQEEMGLGKAARILALEVFWPASGTTQLFKDVPLDRVISVEEGSDAFALVAPPGAAGR
jgi:hypothetical protein